MTTTATLPPVRAGDARLDYRWTVDRFYRAAAAGVFDDPGRIDLVHGRLVEKMPQSPLHRASRIRVSRLLRSALPPVLEVADECPIHIASDGEPVPGIIALRGGGAEDTARHPSPETVALLVEIAVSSEQSDLNEKASLYAQAGISDYWVVLPEREQIVVHREPTPAGYGSVSHYGGTDTISPLAASDVALSVRDLLGPGAIEREIEQP